MEIGWIGSWKNRFTDNAHITVWQVDEREAAGIEDGWGVAFSFSRKLASRWNPFARGGYSDSGGALYKRMLSAGFGYDVNDRGDFEQIILGNIRARAHFLALLTPSALERCENPKDWMRREIETAIDEMRNVVPLMLDHFDFDNPAVAKRLVGELELLKHYNALEVPPAYFLEAMERLRQKYLSLPLEAVLHPASEVAQEAAEKQKTAAREAPTVREEELTAQQWFERAYAASDTDEKLRYYGEAIRLDPEDAKAYYNRGVAQEDAARYGDAIDDFQKYLDLGGGVRDGDQTDVEARIKRLSKRMAMQPDGESGS